MTKDQLISVFFIALLLFIIYEIFSLFSPFFKAIFWSAILAFAFYPLYEGIRKLLRSHETIAAVLTTGVILLIVIPPAVFLIVNVTAQAIELYQAATDYVRAGELEKLIEQIRSVGWIQELKTNATAWEFLRQNVPKWILTSSQAVGNFVASQVGMVTKNIFFVLLNLLFTTILVFVFLKDGDKIYSFIYQIAPLQERNKAAIYRHVNETFNAVIRGQVFTALVQAVVAGLTFAFLGIPIPILFAAVTFLSSMIPVLGAAAVWVPLVIYLFIFEPIWKAIVLFFIGFFIISMIDNIVKPAIIGEKTKLPYFLLFFGILGGLKLYGLTGIFLAPVVLSLFFALVKIYQEEFV